MIVLTLSESTSQIVSGIPEYIEFSTDVAANIFYTLDGTTPTYESLIALDKVYLPTNGLTLVVKAVAISADGSSPILTQEYKADSTKLDGPRNIGEGISVLPYGSTSVNNLSFDSSGGASQESSTSFVELEMKASLDGDSKETRLPFINFATTDADNDSFSSSSVNDNVYFDPSAKLILIDGTTEEKLNNQSVKLINRTYNSFDPTSKFYNERLGQKEPIITGNYVRSFYNPSTQEYVSYYYESLDSRWIVSRQKLTNVEMKKSTAGSRGRAGGRFVYKWVGDTGISTPAASVSTLLVSKEPIQSGGSQTLPDNWIIVTENPEGTLLYNGSTDLPEIEAGETYRFVYDDSLEPEDEIGFTFDGSTSYEDGITRVGDPGDDDAYFEWVVDPEIPVPPYGLDLYTYTGDTPSLDDVVTVSGSSYRPIPFAPTVNSVTGGDGEVSVSITAGGAGSPAITDYEYSLDGGLNWISIGSTASPLVISGLSNGVSYNIQIRAVNDNGPGDSSPSFSATPSTTPSAPSAYSLTHGDEQLIVSVTADDGGSPITDYEYSLDGGAFVSAGTTTSPFSITGLTNGQSYDVVVRAVNDNGPGTSSSTESATPSTIPGQPTIGTIISGDETLTVPISITDNGGSPLILPIFQYSLYGGSFVDFASVGPSGWMITGLTNGVSYDVRVRAINANGSGVVSDPESATPGLPSAPFITSIVGGDEFLSIYYTPGPDGGDPIVGYQIRLNGGPWTPTVNYPNPALIGGGLVNGTPYDVEMRAVNVNGESGPSNLVTGTPAWSPTDVTPAAWFDASDTSSYLVSGSNVTAVTDKAGNATVTVNGTPNITNLLDGKNVWKFESNNNEDFTTDEFAQVDASGNHWAIGLMQWNTRNDPQDSFWSTENNTVSSGSKRDYAISAGASAFDGELDLDALSDPNRISSSIGNKEDFDSGIAKNTWVIVCAIFNKTGNQIAVRVNGTNAFTPVNDYDNSLNTNMDLRIFRNRANERMGGMMAEFFAVADLPGTGGTDITDVEKAEGYLAHKWGLESELPSGHPYKSSPP